MPTSSNNKSRGTSIWIPTLLALMLVGGMLIGTRINNNAPFISILPKDGASPRIAIGEGKLEEILRYVDAKYVDDVNREKLTDEAIAAMLKELDPHSNHISVEQLQGVSEQLEGNFDGIGVEFLFLDDTVTIVTPLAGGPSEAVGIMAGDKIIQIEDTIVAGVEMEQENIVNRLRGERGTEVDVKVARAGEDDLMAFTIVRDKIPINSVDIAYMLDEKTGYIKINRFSATTYQEFMEALEEMVEKKAMKDLVIDVRHNPGGYLQQATNLLSQLFNEKGKLLVYTEGRTAKRSEYKTTGRNFFDVDKVVVLIDEGSASASEIVAGAIQDLDRGVVVGRRSFGKGLVQEQYDLSDGAALRLTVARYYTPSGRSIQKSYDNMDEYDADVAERFENGELSEADKVKLSDTTEYRTARGRVVYGGGGITPDIFVPLDTSMMRENYIVLRQHIPSFTFRYLESNKGKLGDNLEDFVRKPLPQSVIADFLDYAASRDTKVSPSEFREVEADITNFLKARLARQLFGEEGFYTIWNERDEVINKALEALDLDDPLKLRASKD